MTPFFLGPHPLLEIESMLRKWLPPWISAAAVVLVIWLSGILPAQKPGSQEGAAPAAENQDAENQDPGNQDAAPVESPLATLDWLLGSWSGGTDKGQIEFSCRFAKNNAFLIRSFRVLEGDDVAMSGMQVVAWDPAKETIRSWTFDSDGGFGEDLWSQAGTRYTMRSEYTLPDGGSGSALNTMEYVDNNTFVWQSTNREIDGQLQPDIPKVVVSRVAAVEDAQANEGTNE